MKRIKPTIWFLCLAPCLLVGCDNELRCEDIAIGTPISELPISSSCEHYSYGSPTPAHRDQCSGSEFVGDPLTDVNYFHTSDGYPGVACIPTKPPTDCDYEGAAWWCYVVVDDKGKVACVETWCQD